MDNGLNWTTLATLGGTVAIYEVWKLWYTYTQKMKTYEESLPDAKGIDGNNNDAASNSHDAPEQEVATDIFRRGLIISPVLLLLALIFWGCQACHPAL